MSPAPLTAASDASDGECVPVPMNLSHQENHRVPSLPHPAHPAAHPRPHLPDRPGPRPPRPCHRRRRGPARGDGRRYLLWKNDGNCCGLGRDTWLHLQPTTWDGTRLTGPPVRLIRQDRPWEGRLAEAPTLVKRAGQYVLLYSANAYDTGAYATGYALSPHLTGPYTKAPRPLLTTCTFSGAVRGPGGQDVVEGPDGRDHLLLHGRYGGARFLYLADLDWADGRPVVRGGAQAYEAERARPTDVTVRTAPGACEGRAVGHIDHPGSRVEFRVFAASPGPAHAVRAVRERFPRRGGTPGPGHPPPVRQRRRDRPRPLPPHRLGHLAHGHPHGPAAYRLERGPAVQGRPLRRTGPHRGGPSPDGTGAR
ncbi:family 43 glycosylhydrolase [Streptomyces finlayi]|nr:family 43 glycosylhydrolase [Streptomyces finlayi]